MQNGIRGFSIILAVLIISLNATLPALAQDIEEPVSPVYQESYEGLPICAPGVYFIQPDDCLPVGPSEVLSYWAEKGLSIPLKPLPAVKPADSYRDLNQKYAKLNLPPGVQAAYYPNMESAIAGYGALSRLPIGETLYVAYENVAYYDGNPFVANGRGEWIRASPTSYSDFQGVLLERPVENNFGWIVSAVQPKREPSVYAPIVNETLAERSLVQVYDQIEAEGTTWYMVGLGQWVDRRSIRVVYPAFLHRRELKMDDGLRSIYMNKLLQCMRTAG